MRSTIALLTSALLTTAAAAQTVVPSFQAGPLAPVALPTRDMPLPAGDARSLSVPTATVIAPVAPTPAPRQTTVEQLMAPKATRPAEARPRPARGTRSAKAEPLRGSYRSSSADRTRPASSRSLGRFWPPVF